MIKKALGFTSLLLLFVSFQISAVWACSGFPYFGVDDLPSMDVLVRATVIDTDDRGYNAILRVEAYYKGEGDRLLTVMRYPPALSSGALVRGYDTSCLYAGRGHQWVKGSQGYFGLRPNGDGTFSDENGGTAHFYPFNGIIQYQEGATEGYAVEFDDPEAITEDAFIDLMLEAGGRDEPIQPQQEQRQFYPLMRFLNITTENGTRYQVNPDRSILQLPDDAPLAISPDGAHIAFQIGNDIIQFQYIWTELRDTDSFIPEYLESLQINGQAVRFANDSSFAAVWNTNQLTIVMLRNNGYPYFSGTGSSLVVQQVAQVDIAMNDHTLPAVKWSADSTTLVWQDNSGISVWNLYNDAEPTRYEGADELLLDVSRHGHYVRYGTPTDWVLLDTETGETHPNMIASPDERFLWDMSEPAPVEEVSDACVPPLRTTCPIHRATPQLPNEETVQTSLFPYLGNLFGLRTCGRWGNDRCLYDGMSWHPAMGDTGYVGGRLIGTFMTDVRQIAYDPQYDQPAIQVGDFDIYFDFYYDDLVAEPQYRNYLDILQLENELDSAIVSLEWGQLVFFDEYRLATMEYFVN